MGTESNYTGDTGSEVEEPVSPAEGEVDATIPAGEIAQPGGEAASEGSGDGADEGEADEEEGGS